jgi:hypothetical protein
VPGCTPLQSGDQFVVQIAHTQGARHLPLSEITGGNDLRLRSRCDDPSVSSRGGPDLPSLTPASSPVRAPSRRG